MEGKTRGKQVKSIDVRLCEVRQGKIKQGKEIRSRGVNVKFQTGGQGVPTKGAAQLRVR